MARKPTGNPNVNNTIVHDHETDVIFTTNDREAAKLLELIVDGSNVTEGPQEVNGFHYQGWLKKS